MSWIKRNKLGRRSYVLHQRWEDNFLFISLLTDCHLFVANLPRQLKRWSGVSSVSGQCLQWQYVLGPSLCIFIPLKCPVPSLVNVLMRVLLVLISRIWCLILITLSISFTLPTELISLRVTSVTLLVFNCLASFAKASAI